MTRLSRQIYLTVIVCLLLVVLVAGSVWRFGVGKPIAGQALEFVGELAAASLPAPDAPPEAQRAGLLKLGEHLSSEISLFDRDRSLIASVGDPAPPPSERGRGGSWDAGDKGPVIHTRLPDGRWLGVRLKRPERHPALGLVLVLSMVALIVALGAYPVVRWLTRRLEKLQTAVETLGTGDTGARVEVQGKDEVAQLAASFNRSAEQIEKLLASHRQLLAYTSHELRTPLARVRLGIEFLKTNRDPKGMAALEQDVSELDDLIEEILIAARLDAQDGLEAREDVDLLALAAEECARYSECELSGSSVLLDGDERLLRRLIRNLLENAQRHGKPPVSVEVTEQGGIAHLKVHDNGEGIPAEMREAVFEPFYRKPGPESKAGFGLGLALVRRIAQLHGGDAEIEPTQNGCTLHITLPLRETRETERD